MIETKPFYTCKYDKAFKEIMTKEENFNILKKVLETILKVRIQEIKLQPLNLNTGNIHIKGKEVDLLVITEQGKIEAEVNTYYNDYVRTRNFSYITSIYNNQVTVGEKLNEDPIFINWITKEKDEQMIKNTQLYRATQEGINIGISQGIKQGVNQGINQGMKKEKILIAKSMLQENMNLELIHKITGLTKEEIEKL